jgi:AraC-like DNA-binding protein
MACVIPTFFRERTNLLHIFQAFPSPALLPFIDRFWGWENAETASIALPQLLPGTGAELYFHYRRPFHYQSSQQGWQACPDAHLFCLRRRPLPLGPSDDVGFIAVRFRAGMLARFLPVPLAELLDQVYSVEQLWGAPGRQLLWQLSWAASNAERRQRIERFLLGQLHPALDPQIERAVTLLYRAGASLPIEQLAAAVELSRRQLERRFLAETGQTPVEMRRLARFQRTVRTVLLDPQRASTDVALEHGYYDQAHFIREFRSLAHATPHAFFNTARTATHFYNTPRHPTGSMEPPFN